MSEAKVVCFAPRQLVVIYFAFSLDVAQSFIPNEIRID